MNKLNILLTNDDGINGEGLKVLYEALRTSHNVYVLCPDSNKSAVSSCISMQSAILINKISDNVYTCSANPADCVIAALHSDLFKVDFDVVISGINKGANLGTDLIYSGTVAAARQAVLYGIPGIAVSLESFDNSWKFDALASFINNNITELIGLSDKERFVNVNALSKDSYDEVRLCPLCVRDYGDNISLMESPNHRLYGFYTSGNLKSTGPEENDWETVKKGGIAVSQVYAENKCRNDDCRIEFKL